MKIHEIVDWYFVIRFFFCLIFVRLISGGNIFYDFFQFLMRPFAPRQPSHKVSVSSLGHDGIRPPNRYGRYINNFDDGARKPRKIPNHHKFRKGKNIIEMKR